MVRHRRENPTRRNIAGMTRVPLAAKPSPANLLPAHFPSRPLVTVFGGTGFLGRRIVNSLLRREARVRIAARQPHRPGMPSFDRVQHVVANVTDLASIEAAIDGADAVANAVSLYVEKAGRPKARHARCRAGAVEGISWRCLRCRRPLRDDHIDGLRRSAPWRPLRDPAARPNKDNINAEGERVYHTPGSPRRLGTAERRSTRRRRALVLRRGRSDRGRLAGRSVQIDMRLFGTILRHDR